MNKMAPATQQRLRVFQASQGKIPDKVPKGEFGLSPALVQKVHQWVNHSPNELHKQHPIADMGDKVNLSFSQPDQDLIQVLNWLQWDFIAVNPVLPDRKNLGLDSRGRQHWRDFWGNNVVEVGAEKCRAVLTSACNDFAELRRYALPAVQQMNVQALQSWAIHTPYFIFSLVPGPFSFSSQIMDSMEFFCSLAAAPQEFRFCLQHLSEWLKSYLEVCVKAGAQGIILMEDLADQRGLIFNRSTLEGVLFPCLAELAQHAAQLQVPLFFHCDGNMHSLLPDLVELGFNGVHSLQPSAGMDLAIIKQKYGQQLCLMGNLDGDYVLPLGTPQEVRAATRKTIEQGAPRGGFILSSCTGLPSAEWPVENLWAMYQTAEQYAYAANGQLIPYSSGQW